MSSHPEGTVIKVMTDEEWLSLSGESRKNLITLFGYSEFATLGQEKDQFRVTFNKREQEVLREAMTEWDMSADAVIRHYFRLGQMLAIFMKKGKVEELGFLNDDGEFSPMLERQPKMAPMPEDEDLSRWGDEGGAI